MKTAQLIVLNVFFLMINFLSFSLGNTSSLLDDETLAGSNKTETKQTGEGESKEKKVDGANEDAMKMLEKNLKETDKNIKKEIDQNEKEIRLLDAKIKSLTEKKTKLEITWGQNIEKQKKIQRVLTEVVQNQTVNPPSQASIPTPQSTPQPITSQQITTSAPYPYGSPSNPVSTQPAGGYNTSSPINTVPPSVATPPTAIPNAPTTTNNVPVVSFTPSSNGIVTPQQTPALTTPTPPIPTATTPTPTPAATPAATIPPSGPIVGPSTPAPSLATTAPSTTSSQKTAPLVAPTTAPTPAALTTIPPSTAVMHQIKEWKV